MGNVWVVPQAVSAAPVRRTRESQDLPPGGASQLPLNEARDTPVEGVQLVPVRGSVMNGLGL